MWVNFALVRENLKERMCEKAIFFSQHIWQGTFLLNMSQHQKGARVFTQKNSKFNFSQKVSETKK